MFKNFCLCSLGALPSEIRSDLITFLKEDLGLGDLTARVLDTPKPARFELWAKSSNMVLCGLPLFFETLNLACDGDFTFESLFKDSDQTSKAPMLTARGSTGSAAQGLLIGERTALNLLSHLSGVATKTKTFLDLKNKILGPNPILLDTRKNTPGLRRYEKYAVRAGGAQNHRMNLGTGAMLKENHLRLLGFSNLPHLSRPLPLLSHLEVEVSTLEELSIALSSPVDVIMLDNFLDSDLKLALKMISSFDGNIKIEVSGNLTEERLSSLKGLDIDYISSGALVHQSTWVDLSLQIYENN